MLKVLRDNNMKLLIPSIKEFTVEPTFTIKYSEDDVRRICKEHINNRFNLNLDKEDFFVSLHTELDADGYEMKDFYCEVDESILSDNDLEVLEKEGYLATDNYFDYALRTSLQKEFDFDGEIHINPISVGDRLIVEVSLPLEYYNKLKKESYKARILSKPLTVGEIKERVDENGYIRAVVLVHEDELLYTKFDDFLELIANKVSDSPLLNDISHNMVGCIPEKYSILYEVFADANDILENIEEV